jgi:hypothetical protein
MIKMMMIDHDDDDEYDDDNDGDVVDNDRGSINISYRQS